MKIQEEKVLEGIQNPEVDYFYQTNQENFKKIPGEPISFWVSEKLIHNFVVGKRMDEIVNPKQGLATADNNRFLRYWWEIDLDRIKFDAISISDSKKSGKKWFPYNKGGAFRRWYGNYDYVVNWENDGQEIRNFVDDKGKLRSRPQNTNYYFKEAITKVRNPKVKEFFKTHNLQIQHMQNLIGNISNYQLKELRRYFNDKEMEKGDIWIPESIVTGKQIGRAHV